MIKIRSPKGKYKTEAELTRTSNKIRGRIRFHGGMNILCWLRIKINKLSAGNATKTMFLARCTLKNLLLGSYGNVVFIQDKIQIDL